MNNNMLNSKSKANKLNTVLCIVLFVVLAIFFMYIDMTRKPTDMLVKILQKSFLYAIVVVSMNLLNGFTGLFSLGQAGFMLIGSYTYAIFSIKDEFRMAVFEGKSPLINFQLPVVLAIILGGVAAAIFAFLIGLPVLKLKSDYLGIATLGFAEIVRTLIQWDGFGRLTNGPVPLSHLNTFKNTMEGTPFEKFSLVMPFFLIAAVCIAVIALLINSTYGRALKAIRDDEIAAEAMGINLAHHKRLSFVISSFFAGIGGALLAIFSASTNAAPFTSAMTYEILLIVVIGGIGSLTGSVIASFLFIASSEWWLRGLDSGKFLGISAPGVFRSGFRLVVFSVIIMVIVLFFRNGLVGTKEFSPVGIGKWFGNLFSGKRSKSNKKGEGK